MMPKTKLRFFAIGCITLSVCAFGADIYLRANRKIDSSCWVLGTSVLLLGAAAGLIEAELNDIRRKIADKK